MMKINYCTFSPFYFKKHVAQSPTYTNYFQTPAGILRTLSTTSGIYEASFIDEHIPATQLSKLDDDTRLSLILVGTEFQIKVWQHTLKIHKNKTVCYQELAQKIDHPRAFRAVAQALGANKIAYFIPCHRVINKNGMLGGYRWGIAKKTALLNAEKI
jgi:O-6-methylguanine DNA methyltransferase